MAPPFNLGLALQEIQERRGFSDLREKLATAKIAEVRKGRGEKR